MPENNPVQEAAAAAAAGRFNLIAAGAGTQGGPIGVICLAPWGGRFAPAADHVSYDDTMIPGPAGVRKGQRMAAATAYAEAYNRALVAQPAYPYPDICRPPRPDDPPSQRDPSEPESFSAWDGRPLDRTRSLAEAARRGTAAELRRWLRLEPARIDERDPFAMTPLAWAVVRGRSEAARLLLAAGADPLASRAQGHAPSGRGQLDLSPLQLALYAGDAELAAELMTPAVLARVRPWPLSLLEAAARGDHPQLLRRMLTEPHERVSLRGLLYRPPGATWPAPTPRVLAAAAEAERDKCWRASIPAGAAVYLFAVSRGTGGAQPPGVASQARGWVDVSVEARRPVVLVLSSDNLIGWRIRPAPGARIIGVLALGFEAPDVQGLPPATPLIINDAELGCRDTPLPALRSQSPDSVAEFTARVASALRHPLARVEAAEEARAFVVR